MTSANEKGWRQLSPEVGCGGKVPFDTRAIATAVLDRCNGRKVRGRHIYRCCHCKKWHMSGRKRRPLPPKEPKERYDAAAE